MERFTAKYKIHHLVYYEVSTDVHIALKREKNIKAWKRAWKMRLIEQKNSDWRDLYSDITGYQPSLV